jgi:hypothetical protein
VVRKLPARTRDLNALSDSSTRRITQDLAALGVHGTGGSGASTLNLGALPPVVQHIVRAAYGDATGHIFLISAAIAVVGVIAALLLKPITLRSSLDLTEDLQAAAVAADAIDGAPAFDEGRGQAVGTRAHGRTSG